MTTAVQVIASLDEKRHAAVTGGGSVELTVAFTDLEDFTTYTAAKGDDAASRLMIGHQKESATIVRNRGGCVLKRLGDGLMLIFAEPEAAVLACVELGEVSPLPLRAGIHCGNVLVTGDDVVGNVVNLAARVTASAEAGKLMITDSVRTAVGDLRGVAFAGPYPRRFKGIGNPVSVYSASRYHPPALRRTPTGCRSLEEECT